MSACDSPGKAFTLVELIVVSAIVGTLLLMNFPALCILRDRDNTVKCLSNLRQIGIAFNDHDGQLGYMPRPAGTSQSNGRSIQGQLGPYTCIFDIGPPGTADVPEFLCPSDRSFVPGSIGTSYGINVRGMNGSDGQGGALVDSESYATLAEISRGPGTSNLVLGGDIGQASFYRWTMPVGTVGSSEGSYNGFFGRHLPDTTTATGPDGNVAGAPLFSSFHTNGAVNLMLADGHAVTANLQPPIRDGCIPSLGKKSAVWSQQVAGGGWNPRCGRRRHWDSRGRSTRLARETLSASRPSQNRPLTKKNNQETARQSWSLSNGSPPPCTCVAPPHNHLSLTAIRTSRKPMVGKEVSVQTLTLAPLRQYPARNSARPD